MPKWEKRVLGGAFRWAEGHVVICGHGVGDTGVKVEADHVAGEPLIGEPAPVPRRGHQHLSGSVHSMCAEAVADRPLGTHTASHGAVNEQGEPTVADVFDEDAVLSHVKHRCHRSHFAGPLAGGREHRVEGSVGVQEHDFRAADIEDRRAPVAEQDAVPDGREHVVILVVAVPVHRFRCEGEGGFDIRGPGVLHDSHPGAVFDDHVRSGLGVGATGGQRQRQHGGHEGADGASALVAGGSRGARKGGGAHRRTSGSGGLDCAN